MTPLSSTDVEFLDTRTILLYTPPCPIPLTAEKPTISIPISIIQKQKEIARVDFIYETR